MKSESPALAPFPSPAALRRSIQFAAVVYRYAAGKGLPMDAVLETDIETALWFEKRITDTMASPVERQGERRALAARDPRYRRIFGE